MRRNFFQTVSEFDVDIPLPFFTLTLRSRNHKRSYKRRLRKRSRSLCRYLFFVHDARLARIIPSSFEIHANPPRTAPIPENDRGFSCLCSIKNQVRWKREREIAPAHYRISRLIFTRRAGIQAFAGNTSSRTSRTRENRSLNCSRDCNRVRVDRENAINLRSGKNLGARKTRIRTSFAEAAAAAAATMVVGVAQSRSSRKFARKTGGEGGGPVSLRFDRSLPRYRVRYLATKLRGLAKSCEKRGRRIERELRGEGEGREGKEKSYRL